MKYLKENLSKTALQQLNIRKQEVCSRIGLRQPQNSIKMALNKTQNRRNSNVFQQGQTGPKPILKWILQMEKLQQDQVEVSEIDLVFAFIATYFGN